MYTSFVIFLLFTLFVFCISISSINDNSGRSMVLFGLTILAFIFMPITLAIFTFTFNYDNLNKLDNLEWGFIAISGLLSFFVIELSDKLARTFSKY